MKYVYRVREKGSMTLTEKNKLHSMPTANRLREVFLKTIKGLPVTEATGKMKKIFGLNIQ